MSDDAARTAQNAKAVADLSAQQAYDLAGRVGALETGQRSIDNRIDLVLLKLGELTAVHPVDRWLQRIALVGLIAWAGFNVWRAATGAL